MTYLRKKDLKNLKTINIVIKYLEVVLFMNISHNVLNSLIYTKGFYLSQDGGSGGRWGCLTPIGFIGNYIVYL